MGNFVSFYNSFGSVPVRQEVKKGNEHFNRRRGLYLQLGIPPAMVENCSVLEFGPGSGDNALYTASLKPKLYKLVEGSTVGFKYLESRINDGDFNCASSIELEQCLIEDYKDNRVYDLVLAEGLLPGQDNPSKLLHKMSKYVRPGGVLVVTTATYVSLLADVMRRMLFPFFESDDSEQKMAKLCQFFGPHLAHLKFVSRMTEDWVADVILHPWGRNYQFSVEEAATTLHDNFEYLGASPTFKQDWRWYKELIENNNGSLSDLITQYKSLEINFLNKNEPSHVSDAQMSASIKAKVEVLYNNHHSVWGSADEQLWIGVFNLLSDICAEINDSQPITSQAITDYVTAVKKLLDGSSIEEVDFASFAGFWGRSQQYVSFVCVDENQ